MIKTLVTKIVEIIFGFSFLKSLYKKNYLDPELNINFWKRTLEILNIQYTLRSSNLIPKEGSCVIVSKSPLWNTGWINYMF